jgi:hypothetical protein
VQELELVQELEPVQELELESTLERQQLVELPSAKRQEQRHLRLPLTLRQLRRLDQQRQRSSVELQLLVMESRYRLYLWRLLIAVHRERLDLLLS